MLNWKMEHEESPKPQTYENDLKIIIKLIFIILTEGKKYLFPFVFAYK